MVGFILVRTLLGYAIVGTLLVAVGWIWSLVDLVADLGPYLIGPLMMGIGSILMFPLFAYFVVTRK